MPRLASNQDRVAPEGTGADYGDAAERHPGFRGFLVSTAHDCVDRYFGYSALW